MDTDLSFSFNYNIDYERVVTKTYTSKSVSFEFNNELTLLKGETYNFSLTDENMHINSDQSPYIKIGDKQITSPSLNPAYIKFSYTPTLNIKITSVIIDCTMTLSSGTFSGEYTVTGPTFSNTKTLDEICQYVLKIM